MQLTSPASGYSNSRFVIALLLSFMTLVTPLAPVMARSAAPASSQSAGAAAAKLFARAKSGVRAEPASPTASAASAPLSLAAPFFATGITATKEDSFTPNPTGAKPGDTISYTVVITNTAATDATNVVFSDTIDPQTTLVAGSVATTPVARPDTYAVAGNIQRSITDPAQGVLANDSDPDGNPVTVHSSSTGAQTTAQGGNLTLNADGTFVYNPPPGVEGVGADSFTYTITDGTSTSTGTMKFDISGMIWFIDNSQAVNGDGRLLTPFNNLASFASINDGAGNHPAPNDNIFLYRQSASDYTGGTPLLSGQKLIGQGATAPLSTITGVTPPPGSLSLPSTGGTNPVIVNSGGNDITIAAGSAGNLIRGLNLGNASGTALASGAGFGNLSVLEASISTTGQALNLNTGTLSATLGALTSGGGLNNINLSAVNGTLSATSGSLSGSSSTALNIAGGNATITYPGNITNSAGQRVISAINVTGGSLTVNGTVTAGGSAGNDAIVIDGNDSAAYTVEINVVSINTNSMDDGILLADLPTGSSVTINSGTVTSQGAGRRALAFETAAGVAENTAGTYNFSGVDFNNTNGDGLVFGTGQTGTYSFRDWTVNTPNGGTGITVNGGSPAITFRRIDQNGGTNGINVSNNTSGSFTVNGTGTTDGSGGTIQNTSARGASFNTANNITLKNMNFASTGTTDGTTCGNDTDPNTGCNGAIILQSTNTVTLDNIDTNGGQYGIHGITVSAFNLSNANIQNHGNENNEHGMRFLGLTGASAMTNLVVTGSATDGMRINNTSGSLTLTVTNGTFKDNQVGIGNNGVTLDGDLTSTITATFLGSTFQNNKATGLLTSFTGTGKQDITVTTNGATRSKFQSNNVGIDLGATESSDITFNINNADFLDHTAQAINIVPGAGTTSTSSMQINGTVNGNVIGDGDVESGSAIAEGMRFAMQGGSVAAITVSNNTISHTNNQGISVLSRDGGGSVSMTVLNNTVNAPDNNNEATPPAIHGIHFDQNIPNAFGTRSMCIDVNGNTSAGHTASGGVGIRVRQGTGSNFQIEGYGGAPNDTAAVQNYLDPPKNNATVSASGTNFTGGSCVNSVMNSFQPAAREQYARNAQDAPQAVDNNSTLAQNVKTASAPMVETAKATNVSRTDAGTKATTRSIADIIARASREGRSQADSIELASADRAVANYVAATRSSDARFTRALRSDAQRAVTDAGTGRAATSRQPKALATSATLFAGETVTRNIGVLPAGQSVTITFQVTVNDPFTGASDQVSNRGKVTSDSYPGVEVLTENKDGATVTGGPTITPVEAPPDVTINPATVTEPSTGSTPALFTVSLSRAPSSNVTVNFETQDGTATTADGDYTYTSGTLTFTAGQRVQTISVPVLHNAPDPEPDETFKVKLTGTTGGRLQASPLDEATGTITAVSTPAPVVISEFRSAGPNGAADEFVELYNTTQGDVDISGWSIVQLAAGNCEATPAIVATIPAGTILNSREHYLLVGSGYAAGTLNAYAAPEAGAPTFSPSLDDGASIALFKASTIEGLTSTTRVDVVGFLGGTGNNCDLMREGSGLQSPAGAGSNSDYSFTRTPDEVADDTNNNATDFIIVSTTPTTPVGSNATPIQGSPSPQNSSSPKWKSNTEIDSGLIAPGVGQDKSPNRHIVRTPYNDAITPSGPDGNPATPYVSTMSIQRRYTNNTGQPITKLRFRVVDMTTTNVPNIYAPSTQVDLRLLSSDGVTRAPVGYNLKGLTLDRAANQPRGGGINSSVTSGTIDITPLPANDNPGTPILENAIDVQFLLGYTGSGKFRFFIIVEALP